MQPYKQEQYGEGGHMFTAFTYRPISLKSSSFHDLQLADETMCRIVATGKVASSMPLDAEGKRREWLQFGILVVRNERPELHIFLVNGIIFPVMKSLLTHPQICKIMWGADDDKDIIFNQYRIKIHPILDLQSCAAVSEFCETKSLAQEAARLKALQKVPFVHEAYDWDADLEVTSTACEYARREPITLLTATPTLISGFKISGDIDITVGTAKAGKQTIWQQIQVDIDTARSRSSASNAIFTKLRQQLCARFVHDATVHEFCGALLKTVKFDVDTVANERKEKRSLASLRDVCIEHDEDTGHLVLKICIQFSRSYFANWLGVLGFARNS